MSECKANESEFVVTVGSYDKFSQDRALVAEAILKQTCRTSDAVVGVEQLPLCQAMEEVGIVEFGKIR